jgi:hypothetical protein
MKQSRNKWNIKLMMMLFENYPKSLCTLFWSQVWTFLWAIVCFPFYIIGIITLLFFKDDQFRGYFRTALKGFLTFIGGLLLFSGIYMFFVTPKSVFFDLGIVFWVTTLFIIALFFVNLFQENVSYSDNLTIKYLKAKKNKVCPKIDWED